MALYKDFESKQDIFDLIKKFDESSLFELDITIPPEPPQPIKIKMMKLAQDNPEESSVRVKIEGGEGINENFVYKNDGADNDKKVIKAPLIGTFYASASPDSEPYVKVGDKITKGMVICIIEAMKTMNEIESDADGEIAEILVKNGNVVEYGQLLFRLR